MIISRIFFFPFSKESKGDARFLGAHCEALNEPLMLCHLSAAHINNLLGTKIDKLI